MIVSAWNPPTDELEKTYLSSVVYKDNTQMSVKNNQGITQNDVVLIGEMGMEQSEIATLASVTGNQTITAANGLKFSHSPDEPVYKLRYDQILFYRSDSIDGLYTLIHTTSIDVDNRDGITYYKDEAGTSNSYYKTRYRHSVSSVESDMSDPISAEGYAQESIGNVIETVVSRVKDKGYSILTVEDYLALGDEVNHDITSQSDKPYDFMRESVSLDRVAGQNYLDLPEDYHKFDWLEYGNNFGGAQRSGRLIPISLKKFHVGYGNVRESDNITRIALDGDRILIHPTPRTNGTGVFTLHYYSDLAPFTDPSQIVKTPNTLIYRYKFLSEAYAVKAETDPSFGALSTRYEQKYGNELMKLQRFNRKDVGTARSFMDSQRTSSLSNVSRRRYKL